MVLRQVTRIGDLIFQRTQKRVEIVVPGLIRYPLGGDSIIISKHCSMDTGSEAGTTGFLRLLIKFGGSILVIQFAPSKYNKSG